jgi:hypothetical protein
MGVKSPVPEQEGADMESILYTPGYEGPEMILLANADPEAGGR